MPSTSALSLIDFVDLGPLTTTFSAPAACATGDDHLGLARPSNPGFPVLFKDCELPTWGDCIPSGAEIDKDYAEREGDFERNLAVYYHSGSVCPDSWTTAGVAAKDGNGKLSTEGVFAPSDVTTAPKFNPTPNIFMEALGPNETAIVCCPSGYTANEGVGCHSTVPMSSYTDTVVCSRSTAGGRSFVDVTFTYAGEQVTGIAVDRFGTTADIVSRTTAPPGEGPAWVAATYVPGVTLVHGGNGGDGDDKPPQESDKPTKSGGGSGDEHNGEVSSTGAPESETLGQPEPTSQSGSKSDSSTALTTSKVSKSESTSVVSSGSPASPVPTPSGGVQPGGGSGSGNGGGDGSGNGNSGNGNGSQGGQGGETGSNERPENAANARWGSMTGTVTAVWGLAALSGVLVAAL